MNLFNLFYFSCFYCTGRPTGRPRPGHRPDPCLRRPAPDRGQAGGGPEAAGLVAGPSRGEGRALARTDRPRGRPRPGARPEHGHGDRRWPPVNRRRERRIGSGERAKRTQASPEYHGRVGVGGERQESPESSRAAAAEVGDVEDEFVGDEAPRLDSTYGEA